jgi:lysozyme
MKGIDVSVHNGIVDWQVVKEAGCDFAIIRLGYGNKHLDGRFTDNVNGAIAAGLKIGVYYYSYALDIEAAAAEAQFVHEVLQDHGVNPELRIWFDMEDADGYKKRKGMPDNQTITDMCSTFICELNNAGYSHVGIYASYSWLTDIIDTSQLADYVSYWNAQWGKSNDFPSAKMWQHTDSLEINGQIFDGNEYFE